MPDLKDKIVVITGAGSGIGAASARLVKASGGKIVATDITDKDTISEASNADQNDLVLQLDVSDEAAVEAAIKEAIEKFGQINGLVNSAGISIPVSVHNMDMDIWKKTLDVQLNGTVYLCRYVIRQMLKQKSGSIVNIGSIYGMTGGPGSVAYNTAKGAILQLTRSLAADYGGQGLRVNSVSPGYIETNMTTMLKDAGEFRDKFMAMHALGRSGQPEEVAAAIGFLLSNEASFITAANLPVDGGFSGTHMPT